MIKLKTLVGLQHNVTCLLCSVYLQHPCLLKMQTWFRLTVGFPFFRLILILNSRDVIQDALVNHSTAFSGRVALYSESVVNPNNKG